MQGTHEPDSEFVERLEWQIGREVRRRNLSPAPWWSRRTGVRSALTALGLIVMSMAIGAGAVTAAYQAQEAELRDRLASGFERRAELARQRLTSANERMRATERRVSLGTAGQVEILERRVEVAEAAAQVRSLELQIEEIRSTGHEPLTELSSPMVSGRDFVGERLRNDMSVPAAALELEKFRTRETEKRVSLGAADALDLEASRSRAIEAEVAVDAFRRKIEIRQKFLGRQIDASETELRVLEGDAEQRLKVLAPRIDLARKQTERARVKLQLGSGERIELAEATLRLQGLETEMAKADLDLALVRRQLAQRRPSR